MCGPRRGVVTQPQLQRFLRENHAPGEALAIGWDFTPEARDFASREPSLRLLTLRDWALPDGVAAGCWPVSGQRFVELR
jgi:hypothetical protein